MILWAMWEARNKKIFKGKYSDPIEVVTWAASVLYSFESASINLQSTHLAAQ